MEREAMIVWHYYENGKLVDYSITRFTGNHQQLEKCLRDNVFGGPINKLKKEGERIVILHQVVLL